MSPLEVQLRERVEAQATVIAEREKHLAERDVRLSGQAERIAQLEHQVRLLQRALYGPKSERLVDLGNQPELEALLAELETELGETPPPPPPEPRERRRKITPHGRELIPDHLPREEIVLDLPEAEKVCPETGEPLVRIGEERTEKLACRPAAYYVKVLVRPKYASPAAPEAGVAIAPLPPELIPRCKADASLLAQILVDKYGDHLPLYRIEERFTRAHLRVPRQTLGGWVLAAAEGLAPLVELMKDDLLTRDILFSDDTPVRMLAKGNGKTVEARLWVYVGGGPGPPLRVYDFSPNRRREHPQRFLADYRGYLQADAYAGYDILFADGKIIEVACWAHVRRKLVDARDHDPTAVDWYLRRIRILYLLDRRAQRLQPAAALAARSRWQQPLVAAILQRAETDLPGLLPSSPVRTALVYLLNQRGALQTYLTDPRLKLDNNTSERAIRPVAIGRKNWLFVGNDRGGRAAATLLSLIQTCRVLGIDPRAYLADIIDRLPATPEDRHATLLPHTWQAPTQG